MAERTASVTVASPKSACAKNPASASKGSAGGEHNTSVSDPKPRARVGPQPHAPQHSSHRRIHLGPAQAAPRTVRRSAWCPPRLPRAPAERYFEGHVLHSPARRLLAFYPVCRAARQRGGQRSFGLTSSMPLPVSEVLCRARARVVSQTLAQTNKKKIRNEAAMPHSE